VTRSPNKTQPDTAPPARLQQPARALPAATSAAPQDAPDQTSPWYLRAWFGLLLSAVVIYAGSKLPLSQYITPQHGLGYALGIVGGSLMLSLTLYPLRKRLPSLGFLGSIKAWFNAHMILGVVGPILVLYHSNFSLGALNSNVALICMLLVSGSGVIGRFFYTRVHEGLTDRRNNQTDLRAGATELKQKVAGSQFVPELLTKIDQAEARVLSCKRQSLHVMLRPIVVTALTWVEQRRLIRAASAELRAAAKQSRVLAQQHGHFLKAVRRYIKKRLQAAREVAEFESYERLFSMWHLLHTPLFFLLLAAGIVHVIAVHVY
jgi:hypothetical protein